MLVEVPLPMVEVWEELQAQVEQLTGEAGKWNWTVTRGCSMTGGGSARYGKESSRD